MKDRLRKVQFKYLDYLFENICAVKSENCPDSTLFRQNDKVILELENSGTLWVLHSIWTNVSDMFSYEYNETQRLIKEWMEEQLKQEVVTPINFLYKGLFSVEAQLKSGEVTPVHLFSKNRLQVEEQLKQEVVTPVSVDPYRIIVRWKNN